MSTNYLRHLSSKGRSSSLSPWVWARLSNLLLANRTWQKWWWCVTSRLYAKKHCSFSSLLSVKFLALRQARPHVVKMLQQPCGCRHGKELKPPANSQHEQTALWVSISEVGPPSSQAKPETWTATSQETISLNNPAELLVNSWPTEICEVMYVHCCFKLLILE